jgi:hypothetical protein
MGGIHDRVSIHARDVKSGYNAGVRESETHVYPFRMARKYHGGRYSADPIQRWTAE